MGGCECKPHNREEPHKEPTETRAKNERTNTCETARAHRASQPEQVVANGGAGRAIASPTKEHHYGTRSWYRSGNHEFLHRNS